MLLDLASIRIRVVMGAVATPAEPLKLFDHDPSRLVVILYNTVGVNSYPIIARTASGIVAVAGLSAYATPLEIYGAEEIWVCGTSGNGALVEDSIAWQAIYRA